MREHCGCEVILYDNDYYFDEERGRLKKLVDSNSLILVIAKQERYSEQHKEIVAKVRDGFSKTLPIVVIPDGFGDERFNGDPADPLVYVYDHTDAELVTLVNRLVAEWKPPLNWLGAETPEDQAILLQQLENAYRKHYLDDDSDRMLGSPDHNHQVVAEALRIRLLPSSLIKAEFDDTIERKVRVFVTAQTSVYEKELERIRTMTEDERKEFDHRLMRARGYEPAEGGGVFVTRATCGNGVNGFAIDPVTLENLTTHRFGEHHLAKDMLARRIERIEALRNRKNCYELSEDDERKCHWRLMSGLIFSEIDGFTTPILCLYREDVDDEGVKKVASFLRKEMMFIPVTPDGQLIEG
ncbi:MAG: hypothetical protein Q7R65_00930 [bacterium]|nr:hypothetical protein [bacterium]